MTKLKLGAMALLLTLGWSNLGLAWQAETRAVPKQEPATRTTQQGFDRPLVEYFASKLAMCNNSGIEIAQFAAGKATNPEVKQFAEMIAKDHAKFNEKLKPFVAGFGVEPMTGSPTAHKPTSEGAAKTDTEKPEASVAAKDKPAEAQPPAIAKPTTETSFKTGDNPTLQRLFDFWKAVNESGMASYKDMLSKKSGTEFDKAFVMSQAAGHAMILPEWKTLESRTTGEFQSAVREIRTSIEGHLAKAESLCKTLEGAK